MTAPGESLAREARTAYYRALHGVPERPDDGTGDVTRVISCYALSGRLAYVSSQAPPEFDAPEEMQAVADWHGRQQGAGT